MADDRKEKNMEWVNVNNELPVVGKYVLISFSNFSVPCVGRYEIDENGGAFYLGDEDESCVHQDLFVNAWMPLPEPYKPSDDVTNEGLDYKLFSLINCDTCYDARKIIDTVSDDDLRGFVLALYEKLHELCPPLEKKCLHENMYNLLCDVRFRVLYLGMSKNEALKLLFDFIDGISKMIIYLANNIWHADVLENVSQEHNYKCCENCDLDCKPHCVFHDFHFD